MRLKCTDRRTAAKPCGSFGDVSVFSFYPNKHITTGEGGMIMTDDAGAGGGLSFPAQPEPQSATPLCA